MGYEILIVDDEQDICQLVNDILEDEGYSCRTANSGEEAISQVKQRVPHLILLDIWLGSSNFDGIKVLEIVKNAHKELPILMMSGHGNIETAIESIRKGAYDFIEKPFKSEKLLLTIARALEINKLRHHNIVWQENFQQYKNCLKGSSSAIFALNNVIDKVATSNSRIIIEGQNGVGKESIARIIHEKSPRAKGVFISIDCNTISPDSILVCLLGKEEKNNFSIGLLEKAHKGTLYLNSIDKIPMAAQQQLQIALQCNKFFRLGGSQQISVDCRIIASSTTALEQQILDKNFSSSLYHILNVIKIKAPGLKERIQDIPQLIEYFNTCLSQTLKTKPVIFSKQAVLALQQYSWIGNLQQLRNTIEYILIHTNDNSKIVNLENLPPYITNQNNEESGSSILDALDLPLREARNAFEFKYLLAQVNRFEGNISKTADFIGMERSALHRKLKDLKLQTKDNK